VGGQKKPQAQAESFDFDSYNNPNAQPAQSNEQKPNNGGVIDLMDIFGGSSAPANQH